MFKKIAGLVPDDHDFPERTHNLQVLTEFLTDKIYDRFDHEFFQERDSDGRYIPIADRAPSVRYGLLGTVVADSIAFLFGEGRFPAIDTGDVGKTPDGEDDASDALESIIKDCSLNDVMIDAATRGSVGSVCILMRVLSNRLFFTVMPTIYLTPEFDPEAPDTLVSVTELYKTTGRELRDRGYAIDKDDLSARFWFKRLWDKAGEHWFVPIKVDGEARPTAIDSGRSVTHNLGFAPLVWIKNLPGGDDIDGECTFRVAIPNAIEINYQLSQAGRGLKYSSSPTLMIKSDDGQVNGQKIVGDALLVPVDGDAKLLEIHGGAAKAVVEYAEALRKMALESIGGSRADSDRLSAATSGRAMEMMNQPLINLADKLRSSYGENGLLRLLRMIVAVCDKMPIKASTGDDIKPFPAGMKLSLVWPRWFAPTADDRQADALALSGLKGAGIISTETAVRSIAGDYDIEDVSEEVSRIDADAQKSQDNQIALMQAKPPMSGAPE